MGEAGKTTGGFARNLASGGGFLDKMLNTKRYRDSIAAQQPKAQFWGGSQTASQDARVTNGQGRLAGSEMASAGVGAADRAVTDTAVSNSAVQGDLRRYGQTQRINAEAAGQGFDQNAQNYGQARNLIMGSAGQLQGQTAQDANQLRGLASSAPSDYMRTDQAQFNNNMAQGNRQALSLAAGGGAGAMRAALAGNQQGNQQAALQAQQTRAGEYNSLLQNRQNALTAASGIQSGGTTAAGSMYSGIGAQDQGMAGQYGQRQQSAYGNQLAGATGQANIANAQGQLGLNAANQQTQAGLTTQGQYIGANSTMEAAQLAANQQSEDQRQAAAKESTDKKFRPLKALFGR